MKTNSKTKQTTGAPPLAATASAAAPAPRADKVRARQVAAGTKHSSRPAAARKASPAPAASKIDTIVQMMRGKSGASVEQLAKATGWQNHSVRGAISGTVKKKLGLNIVSERVNGLRLYRIGK